MNAALNVFSPPSLTDAHGEHMRVRVALLAHSCGSLLSEYEKTGSFVVSESSGASKVRCKTARVCLALALNSALPTLPIPLARLPLPPNKSIISS